MLSFFSFGPFSAPVSKCPVEVLHDLGVIWQVVLGLLQDGYWILVEEPVSRTPSRIRCWRNAVRFSGCPFLALWSKILVEVLILLKVGLVWKRVLILFMFVSLCSPVCGFVLA